MSLASTGARIRPKSAQYRLKPATHACAGVGCQLNQLSVDARGGLRPPKPCPYRKQQRFDVPRLVAGSVE